jgi:sortase A
MKSPFHRRLSLSTRSHFLLRWSRNAFLAAGALTLGYCGFVFLDAKVYEVHETRLFQQQLSNYEAAVNGQARVHQVALHPEAGKPLGKIELTRVGVTAMILEGTDDRTLRRAVGHISGTAMPGQPGNVAIAGHRDTFFRALRNVQQGDEITLITLAGEDRYRVDSISVVGQDDTRVLNNSGGDTLTLVTCYPFYYVGPAPRRLIVRAWKIIH